MANEVLVKNASATLAHLLFHSSVYVPTGNDVLTAESTTTVDLTLDEGGTGLTAAAAVNSDKVDLGAVRAARYSVFAAMEAFSAAGIGETMDLYWSPSFHATAALGNAGETSGVDGAWTGDGASTVAETVPQLQYIGSLVVTDSVLVHKGYVGTFSPIARHGSLVVVNSTAITMFATDDIESAVLMSPVIDEIQ